MTEQEKSSLFAHYYMNRAFARNFTSPELAAMLKFTQDEIERLGLAEEYEQYEKARWEQAIKQTLESINDV